MENRQVNVTGPDRWPHGPNDGVMAARSWLLTRLWRVHSGWDANAREAMPVPLMALSLYAWAVGVAPRRLRTGAAELPAFRPAARFAVSERQDSCYRNCTGNRRTAI